MIKLCDFVEVLPNLYSQLKSGYTTEEMLPTIGKIGQVLEIDESDNTCLVAFIENNKSFWYECADLEVKDAVQLIKESLTAVSAYQTMLFNIAENATGAELHTYFDIGTDEDLYGNLVDLSITSLCNLYEKWDKHRGKFERGDVVEDEFGNRYHVGAYNADTKKYTLIDDEWNVIDIAEGNDLRKVENE